MTGSDLIVLAPWLVFAVGLAVICLLLLRAARASGSRRSRRIRWSWRPETQDPQETTCREKNAQARPR